MYCHLFHSFTLSFCCLLSKQEEVLAGLPQNRRVKMYNSNPSQAPFPPASLLDHSLRVMTGAPRCSETTHSVQTYCAHAVQMSFDLSYFYCCKARLSGTYTLSLCVILDSDHGKKGSLYNFEKKKKNTPENMTHVCMWLVAASHALSTTRSTLGLFQPTIMGNVFPASKLSRSSAQCFLMCRYVS